VAIGLGAQEHLTFASGCAVVAAFALSTGLWWVYFHYAADAVRHALATAEVQLDITRLVLSYGHLSFIAAVVAVAVGLHDAVSHPSDHLHVAGAGFLVGGTALYLATFGYTRWMMFHQVSSTRLAAAAVALLVLPLALVVPAIAALTSLAVVVAVLNAVEYARVERTRVS
jgi:low temperature requirement protein LtrA